MKNEFKLGDVLKFNGFTGKYAYSMRKFHNDGLKGGDVVKVSELCNDDRGKPWFMFGSGKYWHPEENFTLLSEGKPGMVCIILRRKCDEKPILQALENLGLVWRGGEAPTTWSGYDIGSRVINVHVNDMELGCAPTYGSEMKTPRAIMKDIKKAGWHRYESVVFCNTKPSVKQAISNLTTILT